MKIIKSFKSLGFILIFFGFFFGYMPTLKNTLEASTNNVIFSSNEGLLPKYKLGPGDKIFIKIFGYEDFNTSSLVLPDGTVNISRIGSVFVNELTLDETKEKLKKLYSKILRRPVLYINLLETRPIKISITGEVQAPGIYSINFKGTNVLSNSDGGEKELISTNGWPTLVDAIQRGGGITTKGDLRNVTLIRKNRSESKNKVITVDYWKTLKDGTPTKNYYIYDGDSIRIPTIKKREKDELFTVASSSFSPSTINVNVIGEVKNPGSQKIKTNSPLSKAILNAGGLTNRSNKNKVALIRFNENGTITKTNFKFEQTNNINAEKNPILINGDVIVVEKTAWAKTNDSLKTVFGPFREIVPPLTIYRFFND